MLNANLSTWNSFYSHLMLTLEGARKLTRLEYFMCPQFCTTLIVCFCLITGMKVAPNSIMVWSLTTPSTSRPKRTQPTTSAGHQTIRPSGYSVLLKHGACEYFFFSFLLICFVSVGFFLIQYLSDSTFNLIWLICFVICRRYVSLSISLSLFLSQFFACLFNPFALNLNYPTRVSDTSI